MDGQVAVGLEILHRLLARTQGSDFLFDRGDFLDLPLQDLDLGLQEGIAPLLLSDHHLEPPIDDGGDREAHQERREHRHLEGFLAAFPGCLAVGQQVDENHWRNLRMASPHEVR